MNMVSKISRRFPNDRRNRRETFKLYTHVQFQWSQNDLGDRCVPKQFCHQRWRLKFWPLGAKCQPKLYEICISLGSRKWGLQKAGKNFWIQWDFVTKINKIKMFSFRESKGSPWDQAMVLHPSLGLTNASWDEVFGAAVVNIVIQYK